MINSKESCTAWYGWTNDNMIRMCSSSGGAFSEIANFVLEQGGVVFGAYFDADEKSVKHSSSDTVPIESMRRSKYVESDVTETIPLIDNALSSGRMVLFCGTPCQCAGIRRLFGHREQLILCDFFCHGVPSARVFKEFLELKERKKKSKIIDYQFHTKDFGWSQYGIITSYANGKVVKTVGRCEFFFVATMLDNKFLRTSCYTCDKAMYHDSDFTIGDFWGINQMDSLKNDNRGISIVIANTKHAKEIISKQQISMELYPLEKHFIDYAFKVKTADKMIAKRNTAFKKYNEMGIDAFVRKYYWRRLILSKLMFAFRRNKLRLREEK